MAFVMVLLSSTVTILPPRSVFATVAAPLDLDGDGITDDLDQCPNEPETFNGFEDEDGCPDAVAPIAAISKLIDDVRNLDGVSFFTKFVLISQLRFALFFVNNGNDVLACGTTNTFITSVTSLENRGRLTEMQAHDLLQQAQAIKDAIGCGISNAMQADTTAAMLLTCRVSPFLFLNKD